ncbi:phosphatase PAP2 family protein [Ottowia testudinis]|uniref:Phosphatase PAP2 family protein n=1 Tax=Ottowia testudinis TaxID=2816950 RepID=A0A975CEQ6_9BURK|nr:phosphatase PAP2 family protein [Ottowia testudinis]QTD43691.1 phosphatase PAP2 family protein [Ottowia testudinis]
MSTQHAAPWWHGLWRRITTLPWLKAAGNAAFLVLFFRAYLAIQRHPQFEVTQIPATAIDRWIGFQPWALALYLSLWVYTALPVALQPDLRRLVRYSLHICALCLFGLAVFWLWPTSVSESVGQRAAGGMFAALHAVDEAGNACPSLHVATAVFSFFWLRAMLIDMSAPRWLRLANFCWCIGICYSTLAVKQHLVIDVLAGAALGLVGAWWSLRSASRADASMQ